MSKINILIVEDELIIAKNTAKKLEKSGYHVDKIVSSGQAAIDYINTNQPDLILMDIAIKGEIDGIETAAKIKLISDIPIIFLTAYANDETLERASQTGCYGYLIKPFRDRELQATIKMSLSKYKEQSVIQKSLQDTIKEYSSNFDNIYVNNLTNLPNKLFLRDSFDYLISSLSNDDEQELKLVAFFNIHIDRFSKINNCLDSTQKNIFIKEIAERLNQYINNLSFQGITIHLQEDNFFVMIPLDRQIKASRYGQEILDLLQQAFYIDYHEIFLSASIGISFYPNDHQDIEILLEQAVKATQYAQKQGGNRCQLFTFAFNIKSSQATESLTMEAQLHHALEKKELELYYQPKIDLQTNLVAGTEALLRWNHPTLGRIPAEKFISIAEESGLMKPIGAWVLQEACQQAQIWHDEGLDFLKIGINLSGFQFKQTDLFHQITQVLFNTSLNPQSLELELTETILVDNIKANIQRLHLIKKLGIQIALDDFGTGYASLGYLQQFPFDLLKIDACFIHNIHNNEINAVITQNIIRMAHQLNLKVVAEGVETEAELKFLQTHKCDLVQGFLYSRPLEASQIKSLVHKIANSSRARIK
ncbi:EAL domain-containing protein [Waterburya agarophytonicola K14]|uniref:EAL domain-containing protein n=1 Tax=Waterburya agarophytonicola KI4 TaxID=2874699 RepID=A0A964BPG8_9CYAN|nr:EAL domain-containing protein [Waterburya agarophytonicola]MCC0177000.1 EAL domain-containing protein [Waterburya agarophytonicola KI4]